MCVHVVASVVVGVAVTLSSVCYHSKAKRQYVHVGVKSDLQYINMCASLYGVPPYMVCLLIWCASLYGVPPSKIVLW